MARRRRRRPSEAQEAAAWARRHGLSPSRVLPGPRLSSGETEAHDRTSWLSGPRVTTTRNAGGFLDLAELDAWVEEHGVGLTTRDDAPLDERRLELAARVRHVLTFLLPSRAELLERVHFLGDSMEGLAEEAGVTRHAVYHRYATAVADFKREFGLHFWDSIHDVEKRSAIIQSYGGEAFSPLAEEYEWPD